MSIVNLLAHQLSSSRLDALVLLPGPSLTYLTGLHFHPSERPVTLILTDEKNILIVPGLEAGKSAQTTLPVEVVTFSDNPASWQAAFDTAVQTLRLEHARIGVESSRMRFQELNFLQHAAPAADFSSADDLLAAMRIQKNFAEIQAMQTAVKIAENALLATLPMVRPGVTEAQIAFELTINLIRAGSRNGSSFDPIVACGPNAANPHATVSDRPVQSGELLIIDWGATYQDYISDLTRTFAIGPVEDELARIVEIVHQSNAAGRMASQPGVTAGSIDRAARTVIEEAGYGEFFIHRTGHGIGMEVHEPPYIYAENDLVMRPGMAFTIEPGIYLPGKAGVRIEDNVIISEQGCSVLSSLPRELIHLGEPA